jgi:hypothetical protein
MRGSTGVGLAVAACLLLFAPGVSASSSSAYLDPAGDAPAAAPDLTSVQVSNDDSGAVTFQISIPNRSALSDSDLVSVLLNTDGKVGTGCARGTFGAEFALDVLANRYLFGRCSKGRWSFTKKPRSFTGSFAGSTLTLRVNRRDLGGASSFQFRIGSAAATETEAAYDFAPDVSAVAWAYRVLAPPQVVQRSVKRHAPRPKSPARRRARH